MKLKTLVCFSLITLVASISPAAHAQTFSTIYAFNGVDGIAPVSGVTIRAGVLYGTTADRAADSCITCGAAYQISRAGSNWVHSTIALPPSSGARPVFGPDNHLYGTTVFGGQGNDGTVFTLTPQMSICKTSNCFWTEKLLYQFRGGSDGQFPGNGDLIWDAAGNIYGTTTAGGTANIGTVYEMTKAGNNWTEMPIHSFTGLDGSGPSGGVIFDSNGNLFGTASAGGLYGYGSVFELNYNHDSGWTETVLYNFQNLNDGEWPYGGLVRDSAGNLYGAANDGGSGGGGTVFELSPAGDTWVLTVLYSFSGLQGQYCGPYASLTLDNSGNLYGTTDCDGANGFGSVFRLTNTQAGWEYTSLHDFTYGTDGADPVSQVTIDTDGTLYGTALHGGNLDCTGGEGEGCGVVWMIKP